VEWVCREKPMIGSLLEDARPLIAPDGALEITFPLNSFHYSALNSPAMMSDLTGFSRVYFGEATAIRLKTSGNITSDAPMTISEKKSLDRAEQSRIIEEAARTNPLVQATIEIFGGSINKIEAIK
jgi:DNA polymerase-3 subunit gamma/tau